MNVDSRAGQKDFPRGWVERILRQLSSVDPPAGLRERLLAAVPCGVERATSTEYARWGPRAVGWTSLAVAAIIMIGCTLWLCLPPGHSVRPSTDANGSVSRVLAADYNQVRPADINALDLNGTGPVERYRPVRSGAVGGGTP